MQLQIEIFETNGYEWQGASYLPYRVPASFLVSLGQGKTLPLLLTLGRYRLRFVRMEVHCDVVVYARADGLFWFSWLYWWTLERLRERRWRVIGTLYRADRFVMGLLGWRFSNEGYVLSPRHWWKGWRA